MIKSVEKALAILTFIADSASEPVPLGVIAKGLSMDPSTCAHIVDTMCQCHYLERISRVEGYVIGPLAYSITTNRTYKATLVRVASPYMMRLCRDLKENVSLSTYSQGLLYVPYTINYHETRLERKGTLRGAIYSSASGRVILAYMDHRDRELLLAKLGYPSPEEWFDATSPESMRQALSTIKRVGTCIAHHVRGNWSAVACPIFRDRDVYAAVGVSMENQRFEGEHLENAVYLTQKAALSINRSLDAIDEETIDKPTI